jgi:hypothetical protein
MNASFVGGVLAHDRCFFHHGQRVRGGQVGVTVIREIGEVVALAVIVDVSVAQRFRGPQVGVALLVAVAVVLAVIVVVGDGVMVNVASVVVALAATATVVSVSIPETLGDGRVVGVEIGANTVDVGA